MTVKEAESIVKAYSAHFADFNDKKDLDNGPRVFSSFDLPWSPAKLKYAFFVFTEYLVKSGQIDEWHSHIRVVYSSIDGTFKEEAAEINDALLRYGRKVRQIAEEDPDNPAKKIAIEKMKFKAKYDGINPDLPDRNQAGEIEIHNFIVDVQGKFAKNDPLQV